MKLTTKLLAAATLAAAANLAAAVPVATVNGVVIDKDTLDKVVAQVVRENNGRLQDNPALREELRQTLITRELVQQAATKGGLDKSPEFIRALEESRKDLLQQAFFATAVKNRPVTDAQIKAEYERYANQFKGAKEVQVHQIVLADEAAANKVIAELKKGGKFDALVKQSIDANSRNRGGDMGWGNLATMEPPLAEALKAIPKGQVSAKPLKSTHGWHVFRVDDIRDAKAAPLEAIKPRIAQELQNKVIQDAVGELRQKANIQ
ncbi:peptidyl-prolyl cis-trans isomerase [Vogesella sp. GCM10023246]|uniref:peptidylprolyl isomerase n=1 Tax=Vogesella oryzagri TaxID=3160864 RepID=A0ABV1M3U6_9NEIS